MNRITTATFTTTISALKRADSEIPTIRMDDIRMMISAAGTFITPGVGSKGECTSACGRFSPMDFRISTMVADQLTETVPAPTAYSSTSAHPMIHAISSPSVA